MIPILKSLLTVIGIKKHDLSPEMPTANNHPARKEQGNVLKFQILVSEENILNNDIYLQLYYLRTDYIKPILLKPNFTQEEKYY